VLSMANRADPDSLNYKFWSHWFFYNCFCELGMNCLNIYWASVSSERQTSIFVYKIFATEDSYLTFRV